MARITPGPSGSGTGTSVALTDKGAWATTTAYVVGDVVTQNAVRYICSTAHTSGTFATDLTAAKWVLLEAAAGLVAASTQSGTTYTFALADAGTVVRFTNASAVTATVPPNSSVAFPVGAVINAYAGGAGGTTVAAGAGVTIRNNTAALSQYAEVSLRKDGTDEWVRLG